MSKKCPGRRAKANQRDAKLRELLRKNPELAMKPVEDFLREVNTLIVGVDLHPNNTTARRLRQEVRSARGLPPDGHDKNLGKLWPIAERIIRAHDWNIRARVLWTLVNEEGRALGGHMTLHEAQRYLEECCAKHAAKQAEVLPADEVPPAAPAQPATHGPPMPPFVALPPAAPLPRFGESAFKWSPQPLFTSGTGVAEVSARTPAPQPPPPPPPTTPAEPASVRRFSIEIHMPEGSPQILLPTEEQEALARFLERFYALDCHYVALNIERQGVVTVTVLRLPYNEVYVEIPNCRVEHITNTGGVRLTNPAWRGEKWSSLKTLDPARSDVFVGYHGSIYVQRWWAVKEGLICN